MSNIARLTNILICGQCNKIFLKEANIVEHLKTHLASLMFAASEANERDAIIGADVEGSDLRLMATVCTLKIELNRASLADESSPTSPKSPINPETVTSPAAVDNADGIPNDNICKQMATAMDDFSENAALKFVIPADAIQSREPCSASNQIRLLRLNRLVGKFRRKIAFECQICGEQFRYQLAASDHVNLHTSGKLYKCRYCGIACRSSPARNMHEKRKHRKQQEQQKQRRRLEQERQLQLLRRQRSETIGHNDDPSDSSGQLSNRESDIDVDDNETETSQAAQKSQPSQDSASSLPVGSQQQQQQLQQQQQMVQRQLLLPTAATQFSSSGSPVVAFVPPPWAKRCPYCPATFTDVVLLAKHLLELHQQQQQQQHQQQQQQQHQQQILNRFPNAFTTAGLVPVSAAPWLAPPNRFLPPRPPPPPPPVLHQQQQQQLQNLAVSSSNGLQFTNRPVLTTSAGFFAYPRQRLPVPLPLASANLQQQHQQHQQQALTLPTFYLRGSAPNLAAKQPQPTRSHE